MFPCIILIPVDLSNEQPLYKAILVKVPSEQYIVKQKRVTIIDFLNHLFC